MSLESVLYNYENGICVSFDGDKKEVMIYKEEK